MLHEQYNPFKDHLVKNYVVLVCFKKQNGQTGQIQLCAIYNQNIFLNEVKKGTKETKIIRSI